MNKDYYKILGVEKSASKDDIKKAFRKMAHEYHPDKTKGNEEASKKFKEASEAYSILSDDQKRKQYDTFGSAGAGSGFGGNSGAYSGFNGGQGFGGFDFSGFSNSNGGFEFDLGDLFGDMFGGGGGRRREKKGADIQINVNISFKDSVFGIDKEISFTRNATCATCIGTGGKQGSGSTPCKTCDGKGRINEVKRSMFGPINSVRECSDCHGTGKIIKEKCSDCHGSGVVRKTEKVTINIPAGMESGEMLRVQNMGEAIEHGATGNLYIKVIVEKHPSIRRDGQDLYMDLPIKMTTAVLGSDIKVNTLDGEIDLRIPEGITHNEMLRVKGKGVVNDRGRRGDLFIVIKIIIPKKVSKNARKLIEELSKEGI